MDNNNPFKKEFESGNFSKIKHLANNIMPDHMKGTLFTDIFTAGQIMNISQKRYEKETTEAFENLEYILLFEFIRIDDQTIQVNPEYIDSWIKDPFSLDHVFHERCKAFHEAHSKKITLDIKYFMQEMLFHYYLLGENIPKLSKHRFLNLLLLAKAAIIKEHFNQIITFYKEYKGFTSISIALRELVKIYEYAITSKSVQLTLLTTPLVKHKYGISKTTADKYASELLTFFKEKLALHDPDYFQLQAKTEIFVDDLTTFENVKLVTPSSVKHLLPLTLSEDVIQSALEQIIGENFHQIDWGGEINDIFSSHFTQNQKRYNAAFLLKGAGTKGKLTIKKCGKNGDQLFKLSMSNADYYIIQHVDVITQEVRQDFLTKMDLIKIRDKKNIHCCFMDGTDTARILTAYGFIK